MASHEATPAAAARQRDWRLLAILLTLGLASVATLGLAPLEKALPAGIEVPRAALLIQPAILVALFAVLGWWCAPRTGLGSPVLTAALDGGGWRKPLLAATGPALAMALAGSAVLLSYGHLTAGMFAKGPELEIPAAARLAYGGIGEELIARWGILTAIMALALRLGLRSGGAFWLANLIAAALFAAGHFGLLFALVPNPQAWLIAAVVAGNMLPALAFGWLYRRNGLEAAMLAHAGTHLFAILAAALGLG